MQQSIITDALLPIAIALIMFGMGLGLTKQDFSQLGRSPKPIAVGLFGQLVLLPLLALGIALSFNLSAELAIGLMILAACPGGTMSNVISQLARANIALSVSLTSVCTLICMVSTPWMIHSAILYFGAETPPNYSLGRTSAGLVIITLLPVLLGIFFRAKFLRIALSIEVYFRRFSLLFMLSMIVALVIKEWQLLLDSLEQVFLACIALNFISILIGALLGKSAQLSDRDSVTLGIEVGIQNATLAIFIAITFLQEPAYAITAGVYGLVMYLGPIPLILWAKYRLKNSVQACA